MATNEYYTVDINFWQTANTTATTTAAPWNWQQINSTAATTIWYDWNSRQQIYSLPAVPEELTEEEREAQRLAYEARQEQARLARLEREERARQARERAHELLVECLTDEQISEYDAGQFFHVQIPRKDHSGFRTFKICKGRSGNVHEIVDGRSVRRYCIHDHEALPDEDTMLAQKLMLETDIESFERIANITGLAA